MLEIALRGDEGFLANMCLNNRKIKRFTPLIPSHICITNFYSAERRRVERFIEQTFRHSYDAEIMRHYPSLMSVHDEDDNILAALGFRYARDEKLFLENYLDKPIEIALEDVYRRPVSRNAVAEVGNLASKGQGASIFLFTALNAYLQHQGVEINTVTATRFLQRYFKALGFKGKELVKADQSRLSDNGASWGSYYNEDPRVMAGHVDQVLRMLQKHLKLMLQKQEIGELQSHIHPVRYDEGGHA